MGNRQDAKSAKPEADLTTKAQSHQEFGENGYCGAVEEAASCHSERSEESSR
jgi:hypothetical protein